MDSRHLKPPWDDGHEFFVPLEQRPFRAQAGHAGRLDEDRLASAARTMDDALELVAVVDGHRQDVMVATDGGIGIAQNFA